MRSRALVALMALWNMASAAPVIDTFETPQAAAGEIPAVGAVGGVRHVEASLGIVGTPSVAGGVFRCEENGIGSAVCIATYDGMDDGTAEFEGGTLGGIDFDAGNTEFTVVVSAFTGSTGGITIKTRNTGGEECATAVAVGATGTYSLPYGDVNCDNLDRPTSVEAVMIEISVFGTGGVIELSLAESTPVDLLEFSIE